MNFFNIVKTDDFFVTSTGFSLIIAELGFFASIFLFFFLFLLMSPVTPSSRFTWMFGLLVSIVFFLFTLLNTVINVDLIDNGIYFTTLNQTVKIISFIVIIGMCLAGLSFSSNLFTFEYIMLVLFSQSAGLFILSTDHLILIFILIEVQALIGYTLVVYRRKSQTATEAGMKYFLLGSVSSSLLIFGITILYSSLGSFHLTDLSVTFINFFFVNFNLETLTFMGLLEVSSTNDSGLKILGLACIFIGFLFKLSGVPLHFWTPEVYENIEYLTLAYFSTLPKLSVLALMTGQAAFISEFFREIVLVTGVASMLVGSISGLFQDSLKKLLAYSTITNTGYLLILFSMKEGTSTVFYNNISFDVFSVAVWFQMSVYVISFIAISGFLQSVSSGSEFDSLLSLTYSGFVTRFSVLILMVSLSGVPPTAGFFAKFLLLYTVGDNLFICILIMISSVLTMFYYMRISGTIFFYTREHEFFAPVEYSYSDKKYFLNLFFLPISYLNLGVIFFLWFINFDTVLVIMSYFF